VKGAVIVTDLDGTLLEPDGSLHPEAQEMLQVLARKGIPVYPVTSKTAAEAQQLLPLLGPCPAAGVENGAGLWEEDGKVRLLPQAVPYSQLLPWAENLRSRTGVPLRTLPELTDEELAALTHLPQHSLPAVRAREATCPLLVNPRFDAQLSQACPPGTRLTRGNRFLHFQGLHNKASVLPWLPIFGASSGPLVALGDAANDLELLQAADVAIIVPGPGGPCRELQQMVPWAKVAPSPNGRGWAAALRALFKET